jgi:endonuclease/exonuclease/phosphatase family metal-dependent hydrolase
MMRPKRLLSLWLGLLGALWGVTVVASSLASDDVGRILQASFSVNSSALASVRLLDWNIERGLKLEGVMELIEREKPDICFLQEVDLNVRRTHYKNVAEELARRFQLNYVLGIEFQELGQAFASSPAYQGQAIVSRLPIRSPRILRFRHQTDFWAPRWYLPNWSLFQRRLGGRMALVAEMEINGRKVIVYDVHLESRLPESGRLQQLGEIFSDITQYPADTPILIAGDLNTRGVPQLMQYLKRAGFRDAVSSTQATAPSREPAPLTIIGPLVPPFIRNRSRLEHPFLDWILARGPLRFDEGRVHQDVTASDHYPLSVTMSFADPHD